MQERKENFTEEELHHAKNISLLSVAQYCGYTPVKIGSYHSLKEIDSIRIYNDRSWYRWSENKGGSQIDFLVEFSGMTVVEAVKAICKMDGAVFVGEIEKYKSHKENKERVDFILPEKSNNYKRLYAYLIQSRYLSKEVVDYFVKNKLVYEEGKYHNIVFLGKDKNEEVKFASMRGTMDKYGKVFKGDVPGNDKTYGVNTRNENSEILNIFEAAIDMMSYMDMNKNYKENNLALGMLSDNPLEKFLEENPNIKTLNFCLDNDKRGIKATNEYLVKYKEKGYEVLLSVPEYGKDWNETLEVLKKNNKGIGNKEYKEDIKKI